MELQGDAGARELLAESTRLVMELDRNGELDVDTRPEDLQSRARELFGLSASHISRIT